MRALLAQLHATSAQEAASARYFRTRPTQGRAVYAHLDGVDRAHFAGKLVALERDKAGPCYTLCRAMGARRVAEVGTSFGASTIYLAGAVRDNGGGVATGTETEAGKVAAARANVAAAGLAYLIDPREGDVRRMLQAVDPPPAGA